MPEDHGFPRPLAYLRHASPVILDVLQRLVPIFQHFVDEQGNAMIHVRIERGRFKGLRVDRSVDLGDLYE